MSLTGAMDMPVHTFTLDTELANAQILSYPRFIREHQAFGQLPGIRMSGLEALVGRDGHYMEFRGGPERGTYEATVRVHLSRPIRVELYSSMGRDEAFEKQLENVLLFSLQFFEEHARESTLYLAFVPGSPATAQVRFKRSIFRVLFTGNMMNLFLLTIIIGVFLYLIFEMLAPILMMLTMLVLVLSAGRLSSLRSPWRITKERREVIIVQHNIPEGKLKEYVEGNKERIVAAKRRAYETFADCPGMVCADKIASVFTEAGLPSDPKDFLVRRVDVYGMVERIAHKFNMPVPAVVITQDPRPNAAATGFTKNLATVLVTMGLLVQLDEDETELVIGHELSHLRSGDPIAMFALVATEYLLRVYVYQQFIAAFWLPYIFAVFFGIFFFGKFLESRADLEAGVVLGKPKVMAESLKKIGFKRLILEERFMEPGSSRLGEWLRFDPHPPLYFRITRLEGLDISNPPRHPFLSSVRAVASGFVNSRKVP